MRIYKDSSVTPENAPPLRSITDEFTCSPECPVCLGSGIVCEDHSDTPWDEGDGCCGAPGMPCPSIAAARRVFDL